MQVDAFALMQQRRLGIIGTAGRNPADLDTLAVLWPRAQKAAMQRAQKVALQSGTTRRYLLVSGGSAWSDHLAVQCFLSDPDAFEGLELHLPALFHHGAFEVASPEGRRLNELHGQFKQRTGVDSLAELARALAHPRCRALVYHGFFSRNEGLARNVHELVAYGISYPMSSGTKYTYDRVPLGRRKEYVDLRTLPQ